MTFYVHGAYDSEYICQLKCKMDMTVFIWQGVLFVTSETLSYAPRGALREYIQ